MKGLVTYFIRHGITGNLLLILLLLFGFIGMMQLQTTFFPETPSRAITIQVTYPGASPEEIEEGIVLKIEDELRGTTGVDRVTSSSRENSAVVNVETEQKADIDIVLQDVKNAVDRINSFPTGMEAPIVFKQETTGFAISVSIHGQAESLLDLKAKARSVERDFLAIEGISQVTLSGFPDEELSINLDQNSLKAYNISFAEVLDKVRNSNLELTGGAIKGEKEELLIRYQGKGYYAAQLEDIVIRSAADGKLVRLKDVAEVKDSWVENPNRSTFNGEPSVTVDVYNTNAEDVLFITDTVRSYVNYFNVDNDIFTADVIDDSSIVLRQRINMLANNGGLGFFLVLVLLALFLHQSLAFWVALSIPVSFAGMFILAAFFGVTINVISLFGMILVIGILVDDGIVISENIYRHYEMGKPRMKAAIEGTMEVLPAVFSAIVTTVIAFSSFFFIEGRLGDFFGEMAFIVIATLIFSLIEGMLILPAHVAHSNALDEKGKDNFLMRTTGQFMEWMKNKLYAPSLAYFMENKLLAVSIPVALFMLTLGALNGGLVKTTFFPFIERDTLTVNLTLPSGTREDITQSWLEHIEDATWKVNDDFKAQREDGLDVVIAVDRRLGQQGSHTGSINIIMLDNETRDQSILEFASALRQETGPIPAAESLTFGGQSPFGKPISVALRGQDLDEVRLAVEELKAELNQLTELKDVTDNDLAGQREVHIELKETAYLLGLDVGDIMGQVRQGFFGGEVQRLQRGLDEVKVWVRLAPDGRSTLSKLSDLRIRTAQGASYPLSELADFEIRRGVVSIDHIDGERSILVEADIADAKTSVTDIIANMQSEILPAILAKYPGIKYGLEGQVREQGKSSASIQLVFPIILVMMLAVILFTFRSLHQTLSVLLIIPFAFIGVTLGHYIHDKPISLFSALGIIALIGILVNDSLVFVSAFNNFMKEGKSFKQSVYEAGLSRFRPIVLTSITTIAGLGPLMLNKSFQAQFLIPMAISVAYGLLISTAVILVLLPILLMVFNDWKRFVQWFWNGKKVTQEEVEPAVKEMDWEIELEAPKTHQA
jgi:multidrug efflux pump subunit AcrB